jgi:hypothetical protein
MLKNARAIASSLDGIRPRSSAYSRNTSRARAASNPSYTIVGCSRVIADSAAGGHWPGIRRNERWRRHLANAFATHKPDPLSCALLLTNHLLPFGLDFARGAGSVGSGARATLWACPPARTANVGAGRGRFVTIAVSGADGARTVSRVRVRFFRVLSFDGTSTGFTARCAAPRTASANARAAGAGTALASIISQYWCTTAGSSLFRQAMSRAQSSGFAK